jgi:hypothetical protein
MTATATQEASASTRDEGAAAIRIVTLLRRLLLIGLFVAGIAAGIRLYSIINPPLDYGPLPPMMEAAEPVAADRLTDMVEAGDEVALAGSYPTDLLTELSGALTIGTPGGLQAIIDVRRIEYLGSISDGLDTVALYVAHGALDDGLEVSAGFSIRVRDGEVVGVN